MPTYDYRCKRCNHVFEVLQTITAESKADCPKCGGQAKRMISSGVGVIFKGTGFYHTDYKRKETGSGDSQRRGKKAEAAKSDQTGDGSKKTESKTKDSKATESKPADSKPTDSQKSNS